MKKSSYRFLPCLKRWFIFCLVLNLVPHLAPSLVSGLAPYLAYSAFLDRSPHFDKNSEIHFAAVGDYGTPGLGAEKVAKMIQRWKPDFVITLGDNNYPNGEALTIDHHIGRLYHEFIGGYRGIYGTGSPYPRFFPALGNHDWDCLKCSKLPLPYLQYFSMKDQDRYYDFVEGPVHFYSIDSDPREPDGTRHDSLQAQWLRKKLGQSTSLYNIVFFHHPPYSSGNHGGEPQMRWPFKKWGASIVLTGHDHVYERYWIDGIHYIVNGLGGREKTRVGKKDLHCQFQFDQDHGAMKIQANPQKMSLQFFSTQTQVAIDQFELMPLAPNQPNHNNETAQGQ